MCHTLHLFRHICGQEYAYLLGERDRESESVLVKVALQYLFTRRRRWKATPMDLDGFSIHVLRTPFDVKEVRFSASSGTESEQEVQENTNLPYQQGQGANGSIPVAVAGARSIKRMSVARSKPELTLPFRRSLGAATEDGGFSIVSIHDKGRMLRWNPTTGDYLASFRFNSLYSVNHCIPGPSVVYTTVAYSNVGVGTEDEHCVYVLRADTLKVLDVLRGHTGRITALAANVQNRSLLATASHDGTLRVWKYSANEKPRPNARAVQVVTQTSTAALGVVQALAFSLPDCIIASGSTNVMGIFSLETSTWVLVSSEVDFSSITTALYAPIPSMTNGAAGSRLSIYAGTSGGYIGEWLLSSDKTTTKSLWYSKSHCGTVEHIAVYEDIVLSVGCFDGASLFQRQSRTACCISTEAAAVVLLGAAQQVIWGSVDGMLTISSYAEFAEGKAKQLTSLWTIQPHRMAITSISVALTRLNELGSLTIFQNNSTLKTTTEPSPLLNEAVHATMSVLGIFMVREQSFVAIKDSRSLANVQLFRVPSLVLTNAEVLSLKQEVIGVCPWGPTDSTTHLFVATKDGMVVTFTLVKGKWKKTAELMLPLFHTEFDVVSFHCVTGKVTSSATMEGSCIVLGQHTKSKVFCTVCCIGLQTKKDTDCAVSLFSEEFKIEKAAADSFSVVACVMRDNGKDAVLLLKGARGGLQRIVVHSVWEPSNAHLSIPEEIHASSTGQMKLEFSDTVPSNFIRYYTAGSLSTPGPERYSILGEKVKVESIPVPNPTTISCLCQITAQSAVFAVARFDSSTVQLYDEKGTKAFEVFNNGKVTSSLSFWEKKKAINYCSTKENEPAAASRYVFKGTLVDVAEYCTTLCTSSSGRYLVMGYSDGLLQIMDISEMYIFYRLRVPAGSGVPTQLRCQLKTVVAMLGMSSDFFTITLPRRNVVDQELDSKTPAAS